MNNVVTPTDLLTDYKNKDVLLILNDGLAGEWSRAELVDVTDSGKGIAMCEAHLPYLNSRYIYMLVQVALADAITYTFTKNTFHGGN